MSEWIDVPVADVQVGDEVKVDGYGVLMTKPGFKYYAPEDDEEYRVVRLRNPRVDSVEVERIVDGIKFGEHTFAFRRSSIVSARRRKPEPSPKPGDWRHGAPCSNAGLLMGHIDLGERESCSCPQVFRASGGWSRDTRTGQPWVIKTGVEVVAIGWGYEIGGTENNATAFWGHKYKVTGVDRARSGYWILDCQIIGPHSIHARNLDLVDRRGKR